MNKLLTVEEGAAALIAQEIIVYPTEGVYGIGGDARNVELAKKICAIKGRPLSKGLIVLVDDLSRLGDWIIPLTDEQKARMKTLDYGFHHTWLVPKTANCPVELSGDSDDLAVRLTTHDTARALCEKLGAPLISTSANAQGEPSILTEDDALAFDHPFIFGVVDGKLGGLPQATKIQHVVTGEVYRV
ncbi:L-threonylcarbamoyladenylate synthase [Wohlfahrtiimonas sp. G9077]|uniref:L-threonylcarbamoyladenylate synthase n=1 Tax=Wohlfahrtiimonas sp. G9077 TaxID=1980118 RepID=UPI000B999009|nr:L-threonylcarbamoyladenylate synthase [Wohlfahrtiimonas sp. G9077]OYQ73443.1 tRNA threonylcarbamoyladenosine biosynthesis protein RimN [Wohlfahrtiimonas sp. G9077]